MIVLESNMYNKNNPTLQLNCPPDFSDLVVGIVVEILSGSENKIFFPDMKNRELKSLNSYKSNIKFYIPRCNKNWGM